MIGHSEYTSESWKNLPWKQFLRDLFRLQKRVYEAVRANDMSKAKSLQKLILKSKAARMLAIRQVTQLNAGKKTAGIDGKASLNHQERFSLAERLKKHAPQWRHTKLRQIPIRKKDGKTRMLKVPTIADRAWQCLAKYALEPAHEATFHGKSYGFRPGRCAQDAQKQVFNNLNSKVNGKGKRIIELDIEKCFDRINHTAIMNQLIAPNSLKLGIFRCLKAGIHPDFPEQGTPQGGVVSPLLANIALNGIEKVYQYKSSGRTYEPTIRYADDMVIILQPKDDPQKVLEEISKFLAKRGMNVSEKKTKVTAATDGFDFLGWHFKVQQNGKFRCTPSEENHKAFRKKVKNIVRRSDIGSKEKAEKLAPLVRGWRNYHRFCKMSQAKNNLYFMQKRTFQVFNNEKRNNRYSSKKLLDQAFPKVPTSENGHPLIKAEKSPYDGDLIYWSERNSKLYNNKTSFALKKQNHTCGETSAAGGSPSVGDWRTRRDIAA